MLFEDNVELDTLLRRAAHVGGVAVNVLRGEDYPTRADDYDDEPVAVGRDEEFDQDDFDLRFAGRKERSRLRLNQRRVKPEPAKPRPTDEQYWRDEFLTAVCAVEDNLRRNCHELYLDVQEWSRRCFRPDFHRGDEEFGQPSDQRFEKLAGFLDQLRDERYLVQRQRDLSSAWSVGFSPYGLTDEEMSAASSRLMQADMEAMEQ